MNAAGRDLRGSEFVTQDLTGANFDGCNLYGVFIHGCTLKGALFRGAMFPGSEIEVVEEDEVDVTDATINGVWRQAGVGFNAYGLGLYPYQLMSTWSYKNKDLHKCKISARYPYPSRQVAQFDFRDADLRETRFSGDLSRSDFRDARIDGAHFGSAAISFEQLASTQDFKQRRLRIHLRSRWRTAEASSGTWNFSHINLAGSDLEFYPSEIDFTDAIIRDCTIRHGLTRAQLYSTRSYRQGELSGLQLWSIDLSSCDLSRVNLSGCTFVHCNFAGTRFDDAVVTRAQFSAASHLTVEQVKSTWNYKHRRMDGIELPSNVAASLAEDME